MECEYIACSDIASQVIHVRNLLISLGISQPPATIFVDNNSAIHVTKNGRTRAMLTAHQARPSQGGLGVRALRGYWDGSRTPDRR